MAPKPVLGVQATGALALATPAALFTALDSLLALVGFSVFGAIFYHPILLHAQVYTFRDLYPLFLAMDHLARIFGGWHWPPLWNPLEVLGRPLAADLQAGIFYPPNWFFRGMPEPFGFNLSIWFHHVVAAWGAFLFLRYRTLPAIAAAAGAVVFGFGGVFVSLDTFLNGLQSAAWLPWMALAFDRWCDRQSGARLVLVALTTALSVLGGLPEFAAIGSMLVMALAGDRHYSGRGPRLLRSLSGLAVAQVLALGLCAVAVVPFVQYVVFSTRRVGLDAGEVLKHSLEPLGVFSFVFPRRFLLADGSLHVTAGLWERALSRVPLLPTLYVGAGMALLASVAAPFSRPRRRWWAGIIAALLVLALGDHVPGVRSAVESLPAARFARYPEKLMLGVHALIAAGMAIGFAWNMQGRERFRAVASMAAGLAVVMSAAAVAAKWWGQPLASPVMQADLISQAVLFVVVASIARLGEFRLRVAAPLLLICVAADLYRVNAGLLPTMSWEEVTARPDALAVMERHREPLRIFSDEGGRPRVARYPDMFFQYRDLLLLQSASMYLVANLNTPAPLNLGDRDRLQALIRTASADRLSTVMAFFNVAYLSSPQAVEYPGLVLVREPHAPLQPFVYEIANTRPRSFVPRRILPVRSAEQALDHLRTSADPATEVAVAAEAIPPGLPATQSGRVRLAAYRPDRVDLQAEMETPGLVVLSDAFYPGWKAEVNGAAAAIVRVNQFVRGVFVGAGSQRITFEYNPPAYRLGLAITGAFTLGLVGLIFWQIPLPGRKSVRKNSAAPSFTGTASHTNGTGRVSSYNNQAGDIQ